jgi:hypothetical protein
VGAQKKARQWKESGETDAEEIGKSAKNQKKKTQNKQRKTEKRKGRGTGSRTSSK